MKIAELVPIAIAVSIFLTVLALGLDSSFEDAIWLFRRPVLLTKSIVSLNVIMVLLVVAADKLFHLNTVVATAIVAIAISPVPPFFPKKKAKVGGTNPYAVSLLVAASLFSVVLIPGWIEVLAFIFGFEANLAFSKIISVVFIKILLPLVLGILLHHLAPDIADRSASTVSRIAMVLLVIAVLPILFTSLGPMWAMVGNGVLITVVLFALVGLAVGHLLGGPDPTDRSVLALATSSRHPGLAVAIASLNFPDRKGPVLLVVLFHLISGMIVAIPYIQWRKRMHDE